jgi:hypothetical protein
MVEVATDGSHWSQGNSLIWFDTDTLVQTTGTTVATWNASVGGSVATANTGITVADQYRPKLVRDSVNGRNQVYFNGGNGGPNDSANGSWMTFTDPNGVMGPVWNGTMASSPSAADRPFTLILNAQYAQAGFWRYVTEVGTFNQNISIPGTLTYGGASGAVGFGVESSGTALFALQHTTPTPIVPPNSNTLGAQILATHVYSPGLTSFYSNDALIGSNTSHYLVGFGGTVAQQTAQYVIGGTTDSYNSNGGGVAQLWKGMVGDVIWSGRAIAGSELMEINTYEAVKFATIGSFKSATGMGAVYDLSVSQNAVNLLDDVLTLHTSALGTGGDTVTVAGADYVTTGGGSDVVRANDLKFRLLDGGAGFDTFALSASYSNEVSGNTFRLSDYVSNARGMSSGAGGIMGRENNLEGWTKGTTAATVLANQTAAPDGTQTADKMTLTNSITAFDYSKTYTGLTSGQQYTFSIWVKLITGGATNLDITMNNTVTAGTIADGDAQYTSGKLLSTGLSGALSTTEWARVDRTFTADSLGKVNVVLGAVNSTEGVAYTQSAGAIYLWGAELNQGSAPAIPTVKQLTDDARVNKNGYHKLEGFERLDFFQETEKQIVQLSWADVDQLAEKNLSGDPQAAANTSNLYVELGSNDWLDVASSGLGNVKYGYWADANGVTYDRKYSYAGGSDTGGDAAALYVRGGDDAPDFGATSTTAVVGTNSVTVDFNETMAALSGGGGADWTIASAGSSISNWAVSTVGGKMSLSLTGAFNTTSYLDITYNGSAIVDSNGDGLRYKAIVIGVSTSETINLSGKTAASNAALGAGYAIYGNDGKDTIVGTKWDDLIVGGAGNDNLTGGLGADTFRAIQNEAGIDTVTDFTKTQGDKIDLRGILKGTAMETGVIWNTDGTINSASLAELSKYVDLSSSGSSSTIKVDDTGLSGFTVPSYQMLLQSANTDGNLGGMDLQTLINQRVILV